MKLPLHSQRMVLIAAFVLTSLTYKAQAEVSLTNVEIKNCAAAKQTCFTLWAPTASAGSFSQIYVMKNLTLKIENSGKTTETISSPLGYLDFGNNQLVLQSKTAAGSLVEKVFNLSTLERQTYTTK